MSRRHPIPARFVSITSLGLALLPAAASGQGQTIPQGMPPPPTGSTYAGREMSDLERKHLENAQFSELIASQDREMRDRWLQQLGATPANVVLLPPPVLLADSPAAHTAPTYPDILTEFAGEPFFMPFSRVLFQDQLPANRVGRIQEYRTRRDALLAELQEGLADVQKKTWTERQPALAGLAQRQESSLRRLEAEIEGIRADLCFIDDGSALTRKRESLEPAQREAYTALLAAQYQAGLSLDQRALLREIAYDASASTSYFLPVGIRVPWPDLLSPATAAKLTHFQGLRAILKNQLRTQVLAVPDTLSKSERTKQFAALAEQQASQFDELNALAEEIRVELDGGPSVKLPHDLVLLVGQALERNAQLKNETQRFLAIFNQALAPAQVKLATQNGLPQLVVTAAPESASGAGEDRTAVMKRLQDYNLQLRDNYAALTSDMQTARTELQRYHASLDPAQAPTINQLTAQLGKAYASQQQKTALKEYHAAVMTPGLSPAQRRLLFNAALAHSERQRLSTQAGQSGAR